jgi:hypothetical protein
MWLGRVADRTAPECFRLYDKGAESRVRRGGWLWRLELEIKYRHAQKMGETCLKEIRDPKWCAQYVTSRWLSSGLRWPLAVDDASLGAVGPAEKPRRTYDDRLTWFSRTVAPVIEKAMREGDLSEILESLGLRSHVIPRSLHRDLLALARHASARAVPVAGDAAVEP